MGPLQILDMVGLNTAYNIDAPGNEEQRRFARFLKDNYHRQGENSASAPAKDSTTISQPATQITLSLACPPNEY
jgi:3-hydroxyacyl-CoA dehydrogenase